jgi:LysR family nitrogen assimilation transcriptional regulator
MTLAQLANFVRIAELRSLSKAAAVIRIAQPALSRQIRNLEAELGGPLVVRHAWGVSLTPAGEILLEHARRVLAETEAARDALLALSADPAGRVAFGAPSSLAATLIPELAAGLHVRYPRLRPHFVDGFSATLHARIIAGGLDLAVLYEDRANGPLSTTPLFSEPLSLVGPAQDTPGAPPEATALRAALAGRTLILPARPNRLRLIVDTALAEAADEPAVVEVDSLPAIVALVRRGLGWTVLPYSSVTDAAARGEVRVWDLDAPGLSRTLVLAQPAGRQATAAALAVAQELRALVARLGPALRWVPL